ncbi:MAG: hypothetical protein ACREMR_07885 [Gemmatimonadales bacterium]
MSWPAIAAALAAMAAGCSEPRRPPVAAAQAPSDLDQAEPIRLVREYVTRDANGERLTTNPWFLNVVIWEDEPGYDRYTLIKGYEVRSIRADSSTARVEVGYERLGYVQTTGRNTVAFQSAQGLEVRVFTVALTDNGWRIVAPQLDQHVLVEPALRHSPFTAEDRTRLQQLAR